MAICTVLFCILNDYAQFHPASLARVHSFILRIRQITYSKNLFKDLSNSAYLGKRAQFHPMYCIP
jgi:hypothetical protein